MRFKGINITVVSQFDAKRLAEYSTARFGDGRVAASYLAVEPGAQIWLEYSVDGPHPDKAAYLFKVFIDGQVITSWDTTLKHEYCGKTVFLLHTVAMPQPSGPRTVLQRSMAFTNLDASKSPKTTADCIEIRVCRIEHRKRIRDLPIDATSVKNLRGQGAIRIVEHGAIEPGRPARRYQYQLLDPKDEPYATFKFYCRTKAYLERHKIFDIDRSSVSTSLDTPTSGYFDAPSSPARKRDIESDTSPIPPSTPTKAYIHSHEAEDARNADITIVRSPIKAASPRHEIFQVIRLRGSIEDLPSNVPRSPQSIKSSPSQLHEDNVPPSPTRRSSPLLPDALKILKIAKKRSPNKANKQDESPQDLVRPSHGATIGSLPPPRFNIDNNTQTSTGSPTSRPSHQRHKPSHLKLTLDGSSFPTDPRLEPKDRRPLSPFTPSGLLRKISSASILHSQRSFTPSIAPVVIPMTKNDNDVVRRASNNGEDERGGDSVTGTPRSDKSENTPNRMKQMCSVWAVGRSGWTRKQKDGGDI